MSRFDVNVDKIIKGSTQSGEEYLYARKTWRRDRLIHLKFPDIASSFPTVVLHNIENVNSVHTDEVHYNNPPIISGTFWTDYSMSRSSRYNFNGHYQLTSKHLYEEADHSQTCYYSFFVRGNDDLGKFVRTKICKSTDQSGENTIGEKIYELVSGSYVETDDTDFVAGKTYYMEILNGRYKSISPMDLGLYEKNGNLYEPTTDTSFENKEYYVGSRVEILLNTEFLILLVILHLMRLFSQLELIIK